MSGLPKQLKFELPNFNFSHIPAKVDQASIEEQNFSSEERGNLKNAFRYITRLVFKEAGRYRAKMIEIAERNQIESFDEKEMMKIFEKAEQISGERYFRKYLENLGQKQQKLICEYMIWFLEKKYLRYVGEDGKGKRKQMKKKLYIKFKNQIMLPYLQGFC